MRGGKVADDRGTLRPELVGHSHACEYVFRKVECDMELAPMHYNLIEKMQQKFIDVWSVTISFWGPVDL